MAGFIKQIFGKHDKDQAPAARAVAEGLARGWRKLASAERAAYRPVVEAGDGELTASKFSGLPWLRPGEAWPACPHCSRPMQLMVQLDLASAPVGAAVKPASGLLQFFYCTDQEQVCEANHDGWEPFSSTHLLRVVRPDGPGLALASSPVAGAFEAQRIVGWHEQADLPHWEEHEPFDVELDDEELDALSNAGFPLDGDKLRGWPCWIQGAEYPNCPDCGTRMDLLFQIDSENNLPYMFGDSGCGHITQCPNHPQVLAFGWACC